jgi:hypothetical protein
MHISDRHPGFRDNFGKEGHVDLNELQGKYARLRQELEEAYSAPFWNLGKIDRLAEDIASTEMALAGNAQFRPTGQAPQSYSMAR